MLRDAKWVETQVRVYTEVRWKQRLENESVKSIHQDIERFADRKRAELVMWEKYLKQEE